MPSLRQLEYLVALAETLHFRRAAERCNTTQPTLSGQLKALEDRLGARLVERSRTKVILTPLGAEVAGIARRMLADAQEIRTLAANRGTELSGVMRLGLPPTVGPYLLPQVIPELHRTHPKLKLYVREELPGGLPTALRDGRYDLIMAPLPVRLRELVVEPLFRERLYLAVAADHPLAGRETVRRGDLRDEDILALGAGHQLHDVVLAFCKDHGARLRFDYEGTSLDTLREMVAMGLGLTFLPALYVRTVAARDDSIRTLELADRTLHRAVGLAWRRSSARQDSYRTLAGLLRRALGKALPELEILGPDAIG